MSPAAIAAAKRRHQASGESLRAGSFRIGTQDYNAAIVLQPIERVQNDAGLWETKQKIRITVRKDVLPVPPVRKTEVVINGARYLVLGELGGQNASDIAWVIHAQRKLPSPS